MSNRQQQSNAPQQQQQQQPISQLAGIMAPNLGNVITPAAAATNIVKSKIDFVQVEALVLLKIVKQCHELGGGAELSQGFLTGLVHIQDGANKPKRIEITNCFPLPASISGKDEDGGKLNHAIFIIRKE